MVAFLIFDKYMNSRKFCNIIHELNIGNEKYAAFLDYVGYHTSRETKRILNNNSIHYIYNIPYTPILNPIEKVFLMMKTFFKKIRLTKA